jgi:hypothetical protein
MSASVTLVGPLRGETLEYSCATGTYAVTPRPGAPPTGVRFILYANGAYGAIACPLVEIGRADFADTIASNRPALYVVVVRTPPHRSV